MPNIGVPGTGEVPPGSELCVFYRSGEDLLQVALHYLRMGLEQGEACVWITAPPISEQEAECALDAIGTKAAHYRAQGRLEIISESRWLSRGAVSDPPRLAEHWFTMMRRADQQGGAGIRVIRHYPTLAAASGEQSEAWEGQVRDSIRHTRSVALWAYPAADCTPDQMLEVMQSHSHVLLPTRSRTWSLTTVSS